MRTWARMVVAVVDVVNKPIDVCKTATGELLETLLNLYRSESDPLPVQIAGRRADHN